MRPVSILRRSDIAEQLAEPARPQLAAEAAVPDHRDAVPRERQGRGLVDDAEGSGHLRHARAELAEAMADFKATAPGTPERASAEDRIALLQARISA